MNENIDLCKILKDAPKENRDWSTFKLPHWRAERHNEYFYVTSYGVVSKAVDYYGFRDSFRCNVGNYFKTKEEAEESKFYKVFSQ
jgi:hypothetical protein